MISFRPMLAKNRLFLLIIPFCVLAFFPFSFPGLNIVVKLVLLAASVGLYFLLGRSGAGELVRSSTILQKILFVLTMLYAGFAVMGHQLFFTEYPVPQPFQKTLFLVFFSGWLSFPAIGFLYLTDLCKNKLAAGSKTGTPPPPYSNRKLYTIFFSILAGWWLLYLIGFFPANMSPDSFDEWKQAQGMLPLNDHHPIFYTLIIRVLTVIWPSPAIVALFQILLLAAVCSSFLVFLYKAGIPFKWLLVLAILTAIIPTNGIMVVVIWKDILFCTCMVWLTLTISELVTNTYIFNYRTTLICLVLSLIGVALLRHNGAFAAFIVAVAMVFWALQQKQKGMVIAIASFLLVYFTFKKVMMPYWFKVQPVATGEQSMPPVHGMAAVMYYNGTLSDETRQTLEKILPAAEWKSHYNPYSADEYLYGSTPTFVSDLSQVPTSKVVGMYVNTFLKNPFLIIKDRLCGSELLWNVNQGQGSSNYSFLPLIEENDLGFQQHDNGLKKALTGLVKFSGGALDPVVRRSGIFNILLMLLLVYMIKDRRRYWLIFCPLIAANASLLISMTFQTFRYVYYVPLLFGVIWLLAISTLVSKSNNLPKPQVIK